VAVGGGVLASGQLARPGDVADFDFGLGDVAGVEQRVPVGADGRPDECVDVGLLVVLADGGRGEAEPVAALEVGAPPEHPARDVVGLVVDDEAPPPLVEQPAVAVHARGLVGGYRHRPHLLGAAVVFADLLWGKGGPREEFVAPLRGEFAARHKNKGLAAHGREDAHRGDGLAATGRPDEHPGPPVAEPLDPRLLVAAEVELEVDVEAVALVEVAVVADGVAGVVEHALDFGDGILVHPALRVGDRTAEEAVVELLARDVAHQRLAVRFEHHVAVVVRVEPEPARAPPLVGHPPLQVGVAAAEGVPDGVAQPVEVVVGRVPHVLLAYLVAVAAVARGVREVRELRELRPRELRRAVRHHLAALREHRDALPVGHRRPVRRVVDDGVAVHAPALHHVIVGQVVEQPVGGLVRAVERRRNLRRGGDRAAAALQQLVEPVGGQRRLVGDARFAPAAGFALARVLLVVARHCLLVGGRV
jgi:hypothetical protein